MNGHRIPEEWNANFKMPEHSFFILHEKVNMYDVINNLYYLIISLQMKTRNVPGRSNNIFVSIGLQNVMDHYQMDQK